MSGGSRLDLALVQRGLARSRTHAQQLIDAGRVQLNGKPADKAAARVSARDALVSESDGYVSRAAQKLLGALVDLELRPSGRALDAGASTGGFTQVLLEQGCDVVYAVDVGTDQLADELRRDSRVVVQEQTNLRDLELSHVGGEPVDLVVADVSFISLVLLIPRLAGVTRTDGLLLLMVKPQFEVGRERLGKGGVVRSPDLRREAVEGVVAEAARVGWSAQQIVASRLRGPAGNVEYFVLFGRVRAGAAPLIVTAATYAEPGE